MIDQNHIYKMFPSDQRDQQIFSRYYFDQLFPVGGQFSKPSRIWQSCSALDDTYFGSNIYRFRLNIYNCQKNLNVIYRQLLE
jgi:hypothetical protein